MIGFNLISASVRDVSSVVIGSGFERGDSVRLNCDMTGRSHMNGNRFAHSVAYNRIELRKGMVGLVKDVNFGYGKFSCDVLFLFGGEKNGKKLRVKIPRAALDKL